MAKVLYFGSLPDRVGRGAEDLFLPKTVHTVRDLLKYLRDRGKAWEDALNEEMPQERRYRLEGTLEKPLVTEVYLNPEYSDHRDQEDDEEEAEQEKAG